MLINQLSHETQNEIKNELLHNGLNNQEINNIMIGSIDNMNELMQYNLFETLLTV